MGRLYLKGKFGIIKSNASTEGARANKRILLQRILNKTFTLFKMNTEWCYMLDNSKFIN